MHCRKKLNLIWIESTHLEDEHKTNNPAEYYSAWHNLTTANGVSFYPLWQKSIKY